MMFEQGQGDWKEYRVRFHLTAEDEIDLHFGRRSAPELSYAGAMHQVEALVEERLLRARLEGRPHLMFLHGRSTSNGWKGATARSVVRGFMRSRKATLLIERKVCVQHETVFVAKVRTKAPG